MFFDRDFRIVKLFFIHDDIAGIFVNFSHNVDDVLFAVFVADVEVIVFVVLQWVYSLFKYELKAIWNWVYEFTDRRSNGIQNKKLDLVKMLPEWEDRAWKVHQSGELDEVDSRSNPFHRPRNNQHKAFTLSYSRLFRFAPFKFVNCFVNTTFTFIPAKNLKNLHSDGSSERNLIMKQDRQSLQWSR